MSKHKPGATYSTLFGHFVEGAEHSQVSSLLDLSYEPRGTSNISQGRTQRGYHGAVTLLPLVVPCNISATHLQGGWSEALLEHGCHGLSRGCGSTADSL